MDTNDNKGASGTQQGDPDKDTSQGRGNDELEAKQAEIDRLKQDIENIKSKRDKNYNEKTELEDRISRIEASEKRKQEVKNFLEQKSEDYPHVTEDDLLALSSDADLEAQAKRLNRRFEDHEESIIREARSGSGETFYTPEEAEAELKKITESDATDKFERAIEVQLRTKK